MATLSFYNRPQAGLPQYAKIFMRHLQHALSYWCSGKKLRPKHDHIQDLDQVYISWQYSYFHDHDVAGNPDLSTLLYLQSPYYVCLT